MSRVSCCGALAITLTAWCTVAHADNSVAAEALFEQARTLMGEGKYAAACPKLVQSEQLDPGVGTLLNLGQCYQANGQVASAWSTYREAAAAARSAGQGEREADAREKSNALEPKLGKLAFTFASPEPTAEVFVDNAPIPSELWQSGVPIDAGAHRVRVQAPGKQPALGEVTTKDGELGSYAVPALVALPAPLVSPSSPPGVATAQNAPRSSKRETAAWLLGGFGILSLGTAGFFGLYAESASSDSNADCSSKNVCTSRGIQLRSQASSRATVSTIATGVGLGALAGAAVLLLTTPKAEAPPQAARLTVTGDAQGRFGLALAGAF